MTERLSCDRCGSEMLVDLETVQVGDIVRHSNGATWERGEGGWRRHTCPAGAARKRGGS